MKFLTLSFLTFISLSAVAQLTESSIRFNDSVSVSAVVETFDASKHSWDTCHKDSYPSICLIDGKIWFGSIAPLALPKTKLVSLTLHVKKRTIALDVSGMYDCCYGYNLRAKQFMLTHVGSGFVLQGIFSDGQGKYLAKWKIMKGTSIREKLTTDAWDFYWQEEK